jgi:hypothetical protein
MIEISVLAGVVLLLAISTLLLRNSSNRRDPAADEGAASGA